MKKYLVIDFDSTIIKTESLEELAEEALLYNNDKKFILKEISRITNLGMEGKISFSQSLRSRLRLIELNRDILERVKGKIKEKISDSVSLNKSFFKDNGVQTFIVSSGFADLILPIADDLGIARENVLANGFIFDEDGSILGVDEKNPMSGDGGKVKALRDLGLDGKVIMVGDGWTDYQAKESLVADYFIAFTENVYRENVCKKADFIAKNFEDVINYFNKL